MLNPPPPPGPGALPAPELILTGGTVVTLDPARPTAEAVAVSGGRITAVGRAADVLALRTDATEVVDLAGGALLPGFVEAHGHPSLGLAFRGVGVIDVRAAVCPTADEVMATIRAAIEAAPAGRPLTAVGWEELLRPELPVPSREFLDDLAPHHPFAILHNSAHSAWANTRALAAAGVDRNTPDPVGSRYLRDAEGRPTGRAEELPATMILAGAPLAVTPQKAPGLLMEEYRAYAAAGVTTVGELAFDPATRKLFRAVADAGAPVRVRAYRMSNRPAGQPGPAGDAMFREVGVKLWADGSPWVGTIAASFPYPDTPTTRALGFNGAQGCCNYTYEQVNALCREALSAGEQIAVHAQGDTAIDLVLDAVEAALKEYPDGDPRIADPRVRLEHCCLMTAPQYRRAAALGVTCSLFLAHVRYWGEAIVDELFGPRGENWTAARSALDAGVRVSLHNDTPITPSEPLRNIQTAVTRRTARTGRVVGPDERITVEEALRAVTLDAAWQLGSEQETGSLEPGKLADCVVLDRDPRTTDPDRIGDIAVRATYLAGRRI